LPLGRGVLLREGRSGLALLAFGSLVASAERIGAELDATVVNMRYVKPIDEALIGRVAAAHRHIVTLEENVVAGGAGGAVSEVLAAGGLSPGLLHIGIPDRPIQHGSREDCLAEAGLDLAALRAQIDAWWRPMRRQKIDVVR
jgi:1-deoxy-D-xylulose-5-phosphate synthase